MSVDNIKRQIKQKNKDIQLIENSILTLENESVKVKSELSNLDRTFSNLKLSEGERQKNQYILTRKTELEKNKSELEQQLNKLQSQKQEYINTNKSVDSLKKLDESFDNLDDTFKRDMTDIKHTCFDVVGERLFRVLYCNLDRNKISKKIETPEDFENCSSAMTNGLNALKKDRKSGAEALALTLADRLKFDLVSSIGIPILIGFVVLLFLFYKFVLPIFFIFLLALCIDTITTTNKLLGVILDFKFLNDGYLSIKKSISKSIENKIENSEIKAKGIFDEEIGKFNEAIDNVDSIIDNLKSESDNIKLDFSHLDVEQSTKRELLEEKTKSIEVKVENAMKNKGIINKDIEDLSKKLKTEIEKEIKVFTDMRKPTVECLSYIPNKVPIRILKKNNLYDLEYLDIPRGNTIYFYSKSNWNNIKKLVLSMTEKLVIGTTPGTFKADIIELKETCTEFIVYTALKQVFRMTIDDDKIVKDMYKETKSLYSERLSNLELSEEGIRDYNKKLADEDSELIQYKFLFNLTSESAISNILDMSIVKTLKDVGVYTYSYIAIEDLDEDRFLEVCDATSFLYFVRPDGTVMNCNEDVLKEIRTQIVKINTRK